MNRIGNYIGLFKSKEKKLAKSIGDIPQLERIFTEMERLEEKIKSNEYEEKDYKRYLSLKRQANYHLTRAYISAFGKGGVDPKELIGNLDIDLEELNFGKEIPP